jgi:hypothetical protein
MSSVCSRIQSVGLNAADPDVDNDDDCISTVSAFDHRSVASGGSFISLMSCQVGVKLRHSYEFAFHLNQQV